MDWRLLLVSALVATIALAHSVQGERRLRAPDGLPPGTPRGLRPGWHLASALLLAGAGIVSVLAAAPKAPAAPRLAGLLGGTAAAILLAIAALHGWWALAGTGGLRAVIPERDDGTPLFRPGRIGTAAVALALAGASGLVAQEALGLPGPVPAALLRPGGLLLALALIARAVGERHYLGLFKTRRQSLFALLDTGLYTPLCLFLGLATAAVCLI